MALLLYHRGFWSGLGNWFVDLPVALAALFAPHPRDPWRKRPGD